MFASDASTIKAPYKSLLNQYEIQEENQHTEAKFCRLMNYHQSGNTEYCSCCCESSRKNIPIISEIEFAGRFTDVK